MVVLLIVTDTVLSRYTVSRPDIHPATVAPAAEPACSHGVLYRAGVLMLAATLVLSGPVIASLLEQQTQTGAVAATGLPAGKQGWSGPVATADNWMPQYHGAVTRKQAYHRNGRTVFLYIGDYPVQSQGSELISDLNSIADESLWRLQYAHGRPVAQGEHKVLEQYMISRAGQQRLVWYWYRVAQVPTSSEYMAKLLQVYGLALGRSEAAVVAIATDIIGDVQDSRQQLTDFIELSME